MQRVVVIGQLKARDICVMPSVGNITCPPISSTTGLSNRDKDDLNALLYIVVTLLFYSMGIIIGIITYLKREQAEMEEDKLFDMYMQLKREPFNLQKKERVQQMALYLKQLEEQQGTKDNIENWKVSENSPLHPQQSHPQACRRHANQHPSCSDCRKTVSIPETRPCYTGEDTLPVYKNEHVESRGGPTFVCSLTMGACEPLLTGDVTKRVTFPHCPNVETRPVRSQSVRHSYPSQANQSAFTHSTLAVHSSVNEIEASKQRLAYLPSGNETKVPYVSFVLPGAEDVYSSNMFDKGDIELTELGPHTNEMKSALREENPSSRDRRSYNMSIISSPRKQSMPLATRSSPTMQSCLKLEGRSAGLTIRPSAGVSLCPTTCLDNQIKVPLTGNKLDEEVLTKLCQLQTNGNSTEESAVECLTSCDKTSQDSHQNEQYQQQQQFVHDQQDRQVEEHTNPHRTQKMTSHNDMSPWLSVPLSVRTLAQQQVDCQVPLIYQPTLTLQQQLQTHPDDVREQSFKGRNILRFLSDDETGQVHESASDGILTQHRQDTQSKSQQPWKKNSFQNIGIHDVTRARSLGLDWKNNSIDRSSTSRGQPERRGALFFTQRALQKELDGPKSSSSHKHSRPAVTVNRQESVDSENRQENVDSHDSPPSDAAETPIVYSASDIVSGLNLSNVQPSAEFSSTSPPTTDKHKKRVPRMIKSHTLDASKLVQK